MRAEATLAQAIRWYQVAQTQPGEPSDPKDAAELPSVQEADRRYAEAADVLARALQTGDLTLFDEAIGRYVGALAGQPPAFMANLLLGAASDGFRQRFEFSGDQADLACAVELIDVMVPHLDPSRFLDRDLVNVAAATLVDAFYASGSQIDRVDEAIRLGEALVEHGADDPGPWRYDNTLAVAYQVLYERDGRLDALEKELDALLRGLQRIPRDDPDRAAIVGNLAECAWLLHEFTDDPELMEMVRADLLDVLEYLDMDPVYIRPRLELRLAVVLLERRPSDEATWRADLRIAERAAERALASAEQSGLERERCRVAFANILVEYFKLDGGLGALRRACHQYRLAVAEVDAESPNRIPYQAALASALGRLATATRDLADTAAATAAYRSVWATGAASTGHLDQLGAATEWGRWALGRHSWPEAAEALRHGVTALRQAYPSQLLRAHKETWLAAAREIPLLLGYAYARQGKGMDSALALEAGRAVLLAEASSGAHSPAAAEQLSDDLTRRVQAALEPTQEDLRSASQALPLCYLATTSYGGFAVLVTNSGQALLVDLPQLLADAVATQVESLHEALTNVATNVEELERRLKACTEWCWKTAVDKVWAVLTRQGIGEVALIPGGQLSELPLHASSGDGHRFLDDVAVTYAPSARSLAQCATLSTSAGEPQSFLLVQEPLPARGGPLQYATGEVMTLREIIASTGATAQVLPHGDATRAAVLRELARADAAHFSGHAVADAANPANSRLEVAPNEPLTVSELRDERLPQTRMVTLSACESALVGQQLPEEAIGLPGALLQAGVAGVVATMWEIRDSPAVPYLLACFYQRWLADKEPPHVALANAVRWVRTADRGQLLDRFPLIEPQISGNLAARRLLAQRKMLMADWASFVLVGL